MMENVLTGIHSLIYMLNFLNFADFGIIGSNIPTIQDKLIKK
jgi:hypothetical protein